MTAPHVLDAEVFHLGGLAGYVAGTGPPLLLIHSVNATGSAAEVQPLFDRYRASRTVYALDLPGFGLSERSDRAYTPRVMTDALQAMAVHLGARFGSAPLDAMALSLSCEFLARAAVERPGRWGRLALVSPTGFMGKASRRGPPGSTRALPALHGILAADFWSQGIFDLLTRPGVVRYFLERTWGSKAIDERMWASALLNARVPGARHAPLHFLSAGLFSADIHTVYDGLRQPVWVSHGVRGDFTDYRALSIVAGRPNWRVTVMQSGALPYYEDAARFFAEFDTLLATDLTD
jgi:pimeloyl-ACP methyl ester carboxylesterase